MTEPKWWASVADLAAVLELKPAEAQGKDALIEGFAVNLQQEFLRCAGRRFLKPANNGTVVDYFDGGQRVYHLPATPVASVASVKIDRLHRFADSSLIGADLYSLVENRVHFGFVTPCGSKIVRFEYVGGHVELPEDVRRVFNAELRREYRRRQEADAQSMTVAGGGVTVSQKYGLMSETKAVLNSYRMPVW